MGLLDYISQKAQEIPANARAAYRGLLAAPEELAALFSPGMLKGVNQAMNTPATLDRDKAVGMAMAMGVTLDADAVAAIAANADLVIGGGMALYGAVMIVLRAFTDSPMFNK